MFQVIFMNNSKLKSTTKNKKSQTLAAALKAQCAETETAGSKQNIMCSNTQTMAGAAQRQTNAHFKHLAGFIPSRKVFQ